MPSSARRLAARLAVGAALAGAGCYVGPSVDDFEPARSPVGARAELRQGRRSLTAELLAVRDTALLVMHQQRVRLVPLSGLSSVHVRQLGAAYSYVPARMSDAQRARLRQVSRFPQDLPPALEAQLLARQGQRALLVGLP